MAEQNNVADLYAPIFSAKVGAAPLTIRTVVRPNTAMMEGGVQQSATKGEVYVLVSALPQELQERIKVAVQALIAGR